MTKKTIVYTETGSGYRYANYATIDDVQFPQVRQKKIYSVLKVSVFFSDRVQDEVRKKRKLQVHDVRSPLFLILMKKLSIRNLQVNTFRFRL